MTILVTGGSGNVGKEVVRQLQSRQVPFQVGDRKTTTTNTSEGAKTVRFDFLDPSTYRNHLRSLRLVGKIRYSVVL